MIENDRQKPISGRTSKPRRINPGDYHEVFYHFRQIGQTLYLLKNNTLFEMVAFIDTKIKRNALAVGAGVGGFDR